MGRNERGVTRQEDDFSAWYNEVVAKAGLVDRGPAKGTMVIRPYGYRIWELLQAELDGMIKELGHENAYFPMLIPESYFNREAEHVEGFNPELAVVTHAGGKELAEPLVIRPTSETVIGDMMAKWITSHRDLPLRLNQWANVVRWELRPRMLLRTTEFLWQEAHSAHAEKSDALRETLLALDIYTTLARDMAAIPVVPGEKTAGERFAGALNTYTIEAMMRDGKALQSGTTHYLGDNFARAFDIRYTTAEEQQAFVHTTSFGLSTRMVGAIVMVHGDDKGLVLPPRVAPYQVVIVPITSGNKASEVEHAAADLARRLQAAGVRTHVDARPQLTPGWKYNDWELRGVPIRLELGPRDLEAGTTVMVRRIGEKAKQPISIAAAPTEIPGVLDEFQRDMLKRATQFRDDHTTLVDNWDAFAMTVTTGWALALHCGNPQCEDDIKAETAATPRCIPQQGAPATGRCIRCDAPSAYDKRVIFARAY
ncbi:proline--tRNA ligase [Mycobacterium haemophilum]|uniref:Proline--tRNA ligase n=1 Tax=Mycobacterium haemophilum TaxID=29311 RepID=A0A0I9THM7_9MYCO|nr:proline--tRNA ligase [Mycobacterium haemophilum]AKN17591.1 proline--tRNA ligase [Mycobacterium haemophilum DSM 44634]KLO29161.1 proline--tRNA ligase [Mycobacterium haemophilum]KLO35765.1 proline--tRNA ligase [Mycobacterium haemophilum]KLO41285.1 proline--tRNA ligase [Mycobacterium haemophilum]KLO49166.1 proline--tRNA ligase [Mycobacterium haemophilum]